MSNIVSLRKTEDSNTYVSFENPLELCAYVRKAIIDSRMKYKDIAQKADVCVNTVSRLAAGETKDPRIRTAIRILFALGHRLYAK